MMHWSPMLKRVITNTGTKVRQVLQDERYFVRLKPGVYQLAA